MIMNDMINKLDELVAEELRTANKVHPLFASDHEAYAVIKEEAEEAEDMTFAVKHNMDDLWRHVKHDMDTQTLYEAIYNNAVYCAAECIQLAAMCRKARIK